MSAITQAGGKRILILGGGLSGLSYAHYLRNFTAAFNKNHLISKITIVEANNYMGGSIKSNIFEDGMIHELGPRSVRSVGVRGKNTIVLLEQLGLQDELVYIRSESKAANQRYIYSNNQLHKIVFSPWRLFSKLPNIKKSIAGAIYKDLTTERMNLDKYPHRDPSIYDFFAHRFGEDVAENVVDPILRGITAGDARKLSTRALFGDLLEREQVYGTLLKSIGKPPTSKAPHDDLFPHDMINSKLLDKFDREKVMSYNIKTGLQTLPEHLSNSLLNTNEDNSLSIFNQTQVVSINFNENDDDQAPCSVRVKTVDGDLVEIYADHIVSTLPSIDLAKILPESITVELSKALENVTNIKHSPVGCVCLEYRNLKRTGKNANVLDSFGFLTQSKAGSRVLGIAFDSAMFPEIDRPLNSTRMTCMIGGSWFKEVVGTDNLDEVKDSRLEQIALEEIRKILEIKDDPFRVSNYLWKTGIAQYEPGHKERLKEARSRIAKLSIPLTLLGQSYDGVAVNDVVFAARMAANDFVKSL